MTLKRISYDERAAQAQHPLSIKLFNLIETKKTNLSVSLDVTDKRQFLLLADKLGPEICVLKTHIDIVEDFDPSFIEELVALAKKHQFMLFEDRKFADIGNTVKLQYSKGVYKISEWASITNAHVLPGPGIISGLKEVGLSLGNGLLLLAEMSSEGNLLDQAYTQKAIQMAQNNKDFVIGFIAQNSLVDDPSFIHFTPGIKLGQRVDQLGQQYTTPREAIIDRGTDVIIVGRGIVAADNPLEMAQRYRQEGWNAYLEGLDNMRADT